MALARSANGRSFFSGLANVVAALATAVDGWVFGVLEVSRVSPDEQCEQAPACGQGYQPRGSRTTALRRCNWCRLDETGRFLQDRALGVAQRSFGDAGSWLLSGNVFERRQGIGHSTRRGWPSIRLLGQRLHHKIGQRRRHVGIHFAHRPRSVGQQTGQHGHDILALERQRAGQHSVQHCSQAEQIAARIDLLAARLLRRHVAGSAENGAELRQRPLALTVRASQTEIEELHPGPRIARIVLRFQPDVAGLDVAVDQLALVGGRQSLGNLPAKANRLGDSQLAFALEPGFQGFALEEGHGQVGHAAIFANLLNVDDVPVLDGGDGAGFAQKALTSVFRFRQRGSHHLEGDGAFEHQILGVHSVGSSVEDSERAR